MDTSDWLFLGGVAIAGYVGWRWISSQPTTAEATQPSNASASAAASSMTNDGARQTVFGGGVASNFLLPAPARPRRVKLPSATAPASESPILRRDSGLRDSVYSAVLGPQPVAPSPNAITYNGPEGVPIGSGTQPAGSPRQPGDPLPTFFGLRGIA